MWNLKLNLVYSFPTYSADFTHIAPTLSHFYSTIFHKQTSHTKPYFIEWRQHLFSSHFGSKETCTRRVRKVVRGWFKGGDRLGVCWFEVVFSRVIFWFERVKLVVVFWFEGCRIAWFGIWFTSWSFLFPCSLILIALRG